MRAHDFEDHERTGAESMPFTLAVAPAKTPNDEERPFRKLRPCRRRPPPPRKEGADEGHHRRGGEKPLHPADAVVVTIVESLKINKAKAGVPFNEAGRARLCFYLLRARRYSAAAF